MKEEPICLQRTSYLVYAMTSDWHKGTVSKNSSCKSKPKLNKNLSLSDENIFPIFTKSHLENALSNYTATCENITLIEDFNMNSDKNKFWNYFNETFNIKNLFKEPACFQSQHPSIIDLILTNHGSIFLYFKTYICWGTTQKYLLSSFEKFSSKSVQ